MIERWRCNYNQAEPFSRLGYITPQGLKQYRLTINLQLFAKNGWSEEPRQVTSDDSEEHCRSQLIGNNHFEREGGAIAPLSKYLKIEDYIGIEAGLAVTNSIIEGIDPVIVCLPVVTKLRAQ